MSKLNGYDLSRKWFDWCFENPEKVKPIHTALYFFAIEHCNRLGWKQKFSLPTEMTKDAIGVKSWHTYINAFNDLVEWKFFELIERSKNQYSANIIALIKNDEALDKALDKAMTKHISKHTSKQVQSTYQSNDSINKQVNIEQLNIEQENKEIKNNYIENEDEIQIKYHEYVKHLLSPIVYERIAMNRAIPKDEILHVINEFIDTCYGEFTLKNNRYQVEQYFIAWVRKEGRIKEAVINQLKKQHEYRKNTTTSN